MDAIAILASLTQRVTRLERDNLYRPSQRRPIDPGTAALLKMHRTVQEADNGEVNAIRNWLFNPTKKSGPVAAGPLQSPKKGNK